LGNEEDTVAPHPIEVLRLEHRKMARLLDLLERQLVLLENGRLPDYELLTEIADFLRTFPDLYHHPKEDLIVRAIAERNREAGAELRLLEAEHEEGSRELQRFSRALIDMLMEPETRRERFLDIARAFLDHERRHMTWEEGHFFDLAEGILTEADWASIDVKFQRLSDPCFERESQFRFDRVCREIGAWRGLVAN
jgi:hemerythrin-like domain-containing protein